MVLKEACRYQNVLQDIIDGVSAYLSRQANVTIKTQTHEKKKALSSVENETIVVKKRDNDCEISNNDLIDFLEYLVNEKIKLSEAIAKAKRDCGENIDLLVETNRTRQFFAKRMTNLANLRSYSKDDESVGYTFNNDGNQVSYRYPVKEVVTIDFDRNKVKSIAKTQSKTAVEASTKIDVLMSTVEVDYTPIFDTTTVDFEVAYEEYKEHM